MVLSAAERQKRRRIKLKQQESVSVRIDLPGRLHARLKREALLNETGFHEWLKLKLKG